jgi:hypothetical protein
MHVLHPVSAHMKDFEVRKFNRKHTESVKRVKFVVYNDMRVILVQLLLSYQ